LAIYIYGSISSSRSAAAVGPAAAAAAAATLVVAAAAVAAGRHLANRNELPVSESNSYALLFLLWLTM